MNNRESITSLRTEIIRLSQGLQRSDISLWRHTYSEERLSSQEAIELAFKEAKVADDQRDRILHTVAHSFTEKDVQAAIEVIQILRRWRDEDRALGLIDW